VGFTNIQAILPNMSREQGPCESGKHVRRDLCSGGSSLSFRSPDSRFSLCHRAIPAQSRNDYPLRNVTPPNKVPSQLTRPPRQSGYDAGDAAMQHSKSLLLSGQLQPRCGREEAARFDTIPQIPSVKLRSFDHQACHPSAFSGDSLTRPPR
jgi:hypothetical protein